MYTINNTSAETVFFLCIRRLQQQCVTFRIHWQLCYDDFFRCDAQFSVGRYLDCTKMCQYLQVRERVYILFWWRKAIVFSLSPAYFLFLVLGEFACMHNAAQSDSIDDVLMDKTHGTVIYSEDRERWIKKRDNNSSVQQFSSSVDGKI